MRGKVPKGILEEKDLEEIAGEGLEEALFKELGIEKGEDIAVSDSRKGEIDEASKDLIRIKTEDSLDLEDAKERVKQLGEHLKKMKAGGEVDWASGLKKEVEELRERGNAIDQEVKGLSKALEEAARKKSVEKLSVEIESLRSGLDEVTARVDGQTELILEIMKVLNDIRGVIS